MKHLLSIIITVFIISLFANNTSAGDKLSADKIMQSANSRDDGVTRQQTLDMTLVSKSGKKRSRQVEAFSKDYPGLVKTKMKFLSPASMKNTAMLIVDKEKQNIDDQWIYIPGLNSVKKIAAGDQKSNFFGSDLIYADLTKRRLKDYTYKRLDNKAYKSASLFHIEATPNAQEQKITGYKKIIYLINPKTYLPVKTVFHLSNGDHKIAEISQTITVKSIVFPKKTTVVTLKNGAIHHKSIFLYKNIKVDEKMSDAMFTRENIKS